MNNESTLAETIDLQESRPLPILFKGIVDSWDIDQMNNVLEVRGYPYSPDTDENEPNSKELVTRAFLFNTTKMCNSYVGTNEKHSHIGALNAFIVFDMIELGILDATYCTHKFKTKGYGLSDALELVIALPIEVKIDASGKTLHSEANLHRHALFFGYLLEREYVTVGDIENVTNWDMAHQLVQKQEIKDVVNQLTPIDLSMSVEDAEAMRAESYIEIQEKYPALFEKMTASHLTTGIKPHFHGEEGRGR